MQRLIQVEQGMLENENSKLHVLYEAAQSQVQTERERADELAIVDSVSAIPAADGTLEHGFFRGIQCLAYRLAG